MPTRLPTLAESVDAALAAATEPADAHRALHSIARRELRARGYALDDDASRAVLHDALDSFVVSRDGRRAYRIMNGRALDAHEGMRQLLNATATVLDADQQDLAKQDLTPVEQVAAKRKASGVYGL